MAIPDQKRQALDSPALDSGCGTGSVCAVWPLPGQPVASGLSALHHTGQISLVPGSGMALVGETLLPGPG